MKVYRIQKSKYGTDITGKGSNMVSGRWNLKGHLLILYTAENRSLALLEKIESFSIAPNIKLPAFILLEIEVPDKKIFFLEDKKLPDQWSLPNDYSSSQRFGMNWLKGNKSLALSVPSAISFDRNILINSQHPDFNLVRVTDSIDNFPIDRRLRK